MVRGGIDEKNFKGEQNIHHFAKSGLLHIHIHHESLSGWNTTIAVAVCVVKECFFRCIINVEGFGSVGHTNTVPAGRLETLRIIIIVDVLLF